MRLGSSLLACAALLVATQRQAMAAPHAFDLDANMPPHLAIMYSMAWFGVSRADPEGGDDPDYANWDQDFPACGLITDPSECVDFPGAGLQRNIASMRRPLAGIYSASGRSADSLARIDLMLSTVRRPCDAGARFDAFAIQLDSVKFTSKYPMNQQSSTWDVAWRSANAFLDRAEKWEMNGAVVLALDSTSYWHWGANFGLTTQDQRIAALTEDLADMAALANARPGALKVAGRPLFTIYVEAGLMTPAEWQQALDSARQASGVDFYAMGTSLDGELFAAFDALVPWVNIGMWLSTSGASLRDHAHTWQTMEHQGLVNRVSSFPGRVVFGALTPGFDDFTQDWGSCTPREIPRDPDVLAGQLDYLTELDQTLAVRGLYLETWDDWTEGSEFEPDVGEGAAKLVQLRQGLGQLFGEAPDAPGDMAVSARWTSWGQPKNCCFAGGACPPPPPSLDLTCGAATGAGSSSSAAAGSTSGGAPPAAAVDSGCGCHVAGAGGGYGWIAAAAWLFARGGRTRRRRSERADAKARRQGRGA